MVFKSISDAFTVAKRDLLELYRTPFRLVMMFIFPILIIMLFGYMFPSSSTGFNGVHIGIVNNDSGFSLNGQTIYLSSSFISLVHYNSTIIFNNYTSLSAAESALRSGTIDSILYFPPNFTSNMFPLKLIWNSSITKMTTTVDCIRLLISCESIFPVRNDPVLIGESITAVMVPSSFSLLKADPSAVNPAIMLNSIINPGPIKSK